MLDNTGQVHTFILDFENPFDPHKVTQSKLFSYGRVGKMLKKIYSFLCIIKQRVVNGVNLDLAPIS